jgi:hypothetical protein
MAGMVYTFTAEHDRVLAASDCLAVAMSKDLHLLEPRLARVACQSIDERRGLTAAKAVAEKVLTSRTTDPAFDELALWMTWREQAAVQTARAQAPRTVTHPRLARRQDGSSRTRASPGGDARLAGLRCLSQDVSGTGRPHIKHVRTLGSRQIRKTAASTMRAAAPTRGSCATKPRSPHGTASDARAARTHDATRRIGAHPARNARTTRILSGRRRCRRRTCPSSIRTRGHVGCAPKRAVTPHQKPRDRGSAIREQARDRETAIKPGWPRGVCASLRRVTLTRRGRAA